MPTIVQDCCEFDFALARRELIKYGIAAVNDRLGESVASIQETLFDYLDHAADAMDLAVNKVATGVGPVYVFRDRNRVSLKLAREIVFLHGTALNLNAWYDKYNDHGLVVIGVHAPEFAFEKDVKNVRRAIGKFGIQYPATRRLKIQIAGGFSAPIRLNLWRGPENGRRV